MENTPDAFRSRVAEAKALNRCENGHRLFCAGTIMFPDRDGWFRLMTCGSEECAKPDARRFPLVPK